MRAIKRIALTELQTLFYSPIAWLILIIFFLQGAVIFTDKIDYFVKTIESGYSNSNVTFSTFSSYGTSLFRDMRSYLYLYVPLLTMGIFSREFSSGSIKLLYSSPVTNVQIVLGKFLAILVYGAVLMLTFVSFILYEGCFVENFDWTLVLVGLLGMFLLYAAYSSIGIFMSSLTSYQVIAAMGTFAVLAVLNYVGELWQDIPMVRDITYWLSFRGRSDEFVVGLLCSEEIIYFLAVISLFMTFTILRLKVNREKRKWYVASCWNICAVLCICAIGYLSSRPSLMFYYDGSQVKANTLTKNSQDIVKQAKGGLTITTYNNILDDNRYMYYGFPSYQVGDMRRFRQYTRFKPEIKMKYVNYYAKGMAKEQIEKQFPGLSERECMVKLAKSWNVDTNIFLDLEQVSQLEDLSGEKYRFVRVLEREDGKKTFLRIFDDMYVHPFESEITAALKRLIMKLPVVGLVEGHGERNCVGEGDRDYYSFTLDKVSRGAFINQGFDAVQITLDNPVPEEINMLVIAEPKNELPEVHKKNLDAYIARGGNLLIAGEPKRQPIMNPLIEQFGVQFMPGCLVSPSKDFLANFIVSKAEKKSRDFNFHLQEMVDYNLKLTMPTAVGLDLSKVEEKGYKATVLFTADTVLRVWNELETTNFIDDTVRFNPSVGEVELYKVPTMVALSRTQNGKEQKIVISGDADCFSSGELGIHRKKVRAQNIMAAKTAFYWMSDEEVPIDVRRPRAPDRKVNVSRLGATMTKVSFLGFIPLILLVSTILIWVRRKGR